MNHHQIDIQTYEVWEPDETPGIISQLGSAVVSVTHVLGGVFNVVTVVYISVEGSMTTQTRVTGVFLIAPAIVVGELLGQKVKLIQQEKQ